MYAKFAARDGLIIAAALLIWRVAAAYSMGSGFLADFTGFVAGVMLGAVGAVVHEWGHLLAAFASGSVLRVNHNLSSPFIFSYDSRQNSLAQFVTMSLGGFVATAAIVVIFYVYLPDALLASRVARGAVLFLSFLGVFLEVPLLLFALYSRAIPAAAAVKVRGSVLAPTPQS